MQGADSTSMDSDKWLGTMVARGLQSTADPDPDADAAMACLAQMRADLASGPTGGADDRNAH